jgi:hypothetical protein
VVESVERVRERRGALKYVRCGGQLEGEVEPEVRLAGAALIAGFFFGGMVWRGYSRDGGLACDSHVMSCHIT